MSEILREKIAAALHETTGLLAGDVLIFEDCLTLADAILALGVVTERWEIRSNNYGTGEGWMSFCRDRGDAETRAIGRDAYPFVTYALNLTEATKKEGAS